MNEVKEARYDSTNKQLIIENSFGKIFTIDLVSDFAIKYTDELKKELEKSIINTEVEDKILSEVWDDFNNGRLIEYYEDDNLTKVIENWN